MSYKTGSSSYLNVPFPQNVTTTNQIGSFSDIEVSHSLSPQSDGIVTIGQDNKRFKSAYIDSVNTGSIYSYVNKKISQSNASVIDSLPHKLVVSDPASRGIAQGNDFKNKTWTATNYNAVFSPASEFLSRYIPELKTWFFFPTVLGVNNQMKYCLGSPSTRIFNGGTINHLALGQSADLAYSPDHDILVYTIDSASSTGVGGIPTFYSKDRGLTWTQCTFPNNATTLHSYSLIYYVSVWKCFFLFAHISNTSQQSRGLYPIMKSYDGINFISESPLSLPSQILNFNSNTQRCFDSVDFDPSRNILAVGLRVSVVDENRVFYTKDGTNWLSSNTQRLPVRTFPLTLPNGQTLLENSIIPFNHPSTGNQLLFVTDGNYTIYELMDEIEARFLADFSITVTVSQNVSTGVITFNFGADATSLTWSSGALAGTLHNEVGFAKTDVGPATSLTGTFGYAVGQGYQNHIAYSPPLDMWVRASSNNTTLTSSNVSWTQDITGSNENSPYGFWVQNIIQPLTQFGTGNPIPQFGYIKWIHSLQMFLLINQAPNYTGNDTKDRTIWYSLDGMSFYSTQNSTSPKLITNSSDLNSKSLSFDDDSKTLIISHGIISTDIRTYDFSNLSRQTILSLPGWQAGTFTSPAVAAGINTWVVTFDKPFAVAPTGIIITPTSATTNVANYLYWFVSAITTTTFTITANSTLAGTGAVQTWSYMAWEKP